MPEDSQRGGGEPQSPAAKFQGKLQFRQPAIDHAAGSQIGEALNVHWRGMRLFAWSAFALLAVFILFLSVVEYAPNHQIPAFTDVSGGVIRLSAIQEARISEILVDEGSQVEKGAVLAVLDTDRLDADGNPRGASLAAKLASERAMLAREMDAARTEAQVMRNLADKKIAGLVEERANLQATISVDERLLVSLREQLVRVAKAANEGYVSRLQADQKGNEVLSQEGRLSTARATLARVDRDIDVVRMERELAETRLATILESLERVSMQLNRQIIVAQGDANQLVAAPEAGTVSSTLVVRGQSVLVGQTLFTMTPKGEQLVVRVLVPARSAGVVHAGLAIKLALHAYPQEKFGQFDAVIEQVSAAPLMPAELPPIYAEHGPAYVALARFSSPPRGPDGALDLKVGMLADAMVPMERRSAMAWLMEPVLRGINDEAGQSPLHREPRP